MNGKVIAINCIEKKGAPKKSLEIGIFIENYGLNGDVHAGKQKRQVSLMGAESLRQMQDMDIAGFCSSKFVENITTEGIVLWGLPLGSRLRIGETLHEVTQIGKECHAGCAIREQAQGCVLPKQGIFTRILKGGKIIVGDAIEVVTLPESL